MLNEFIKIKTSFAIVVLACTALISSAMTIYVVHNQTQPPPIVYRDICSHPEQPIAPFSGVKRHHATLNGTRY